MSLNQQLDITQPQTDARQGTVRQVAATVKLIEYPSLLGNRDTNAVIGNFQCELVAMQAAFYPDTDGASRIFHSIFHQITDDICHVHGVGRNQQVVREMCLERHLFSLRSMLQAYQLLHNRFQIESTEGKLCLLIVSTGHVAQLPEVGGKVVQLGNRITHHFIHGLLVGTHCFVIEKRDAHLQGLHGTFQLVYHGVDKAFPQLVHTVLLQNGLYLEQQTDSQQKNQYQAAQKLPAHTEQKSMRHHLHIHLYQLPLQRIVRINQTDDRMQITPQPFYGFHPLIEAVARRD